MSQCIINPFQNYLDIDGSPLQNGNLYIGQPNQVAQAAPLTVYYDRALTQPAAQPLLVMNGNVMRAGTPANIFFSGTDYSITLQRQDNSQVYTILSALAAGFVDEAVVTPIIPVQNANVLQNSNFEVNTKAVSGSVVLLAGDMGHDLWVAGASGCTYTFSTVLNITTITILAGTLKQTVPGFLLFSGNYYLGWGGTAQARVNAGAYGISRVVPLVGGLDTNFEFGAGTVSQIQLTISASAVSWKPSSNVFQVPVQDDNVVQNSNFEINTLGVSGTVTLQAGEMGHDLWVAGASGCTYTFAKTANITTLTIASGTLKQIVLGSLLYTGTYYLGWKGTAQARINTGAYGNTRSAALVGGADTTIEFGTGTVSQIQATLETGAFTEAPILWKPSHNVFRSEQGIQSGYPNQFYNSNFVVNQDGYSKTGSLNTLSANQVGFDGWRAGAGGCTFTCANVGGILQFTIITGTLLQRLYVPDLVSGNYMLSWGGSSLCTVNSVVYGQQALIGIVNGPGLLAFEWGTGTFFLPQLKFGNYVTPYIPENPQAAFLRAQAYRTYFYFSQTVYASAGMNNTNSLNYPVPMYAIPYYIQISPPVYTNASAFAVSNINQNSCVTTFLTTALGTSRCTLAFSLDCTL